MRIGTIFILSVLAFPAWTVELVSLTPETYDEFVPEGKEVDAIYGDYALRNHDVVAIIGDPIPSRKANMMTRGSGGCLIDLTTRMHESDQLGTYYPVRPGRNLQFVGVEVDGQSVPVADRYAVEFRGNRITIIFHAESTAELPEVFVRYELTDDSEYITIENEFVNATDTAVEVSPTDHVRMDQSRDQVAVRRAPDGAADHYWLYDPWFGQAYVIFGDDDTLNVKTGSGGRAAPAMTFMRDGAATHSLVPGASYTLKRHIVPAPTLLEGRTVVNAARGVQQKRTGFYAVDESGKALANAEVELALNGAPYGFGNVRRNGKLTVGLPTGDYEATISSLGSDTKQFGFSVDPNDSTENIIHSTHLPAGRVAVRILDEDGGPIPCKVQFYGKDGTPDPFFGPDSGIYGIHNARYSIDGSFEQALPPGRYEVIVSRGNEYDAIFQDVEIKYWETVDVAGTLVRSVKTPGWISAEYHSHSTPSGDNTSHQRGRVLNLLAENLEFAPCTEHSRIDTYMDHLRFFDAVDLMATCTGMELTSSPGGLNHQNSFPLEWKPRTQDGGGPQTLGSPEEQIERLARWDDGSEKLVQQNHPDMPNMFFDRDNDGNRDGGYNRMASYMDVIEIHPPGAIFWHPFTDTPRPGTQLDKQPRNRMSTWAQMFNMGMGVPGVVNTDAHANFHGSGWMKNYVKSSTDDPAEIRPLDMVRASEKAQVIMTNGPYLEVEVRDTPGGDAATAGDSLSADDREVELFIRVQCPNWFDVDRVQVLVNGRYREDLNFTRVSHPDYFRDGVVKFEQRLTVRLEEDAHLIVATIGENSALGPVYGQRAGAANPVAVSNPIFVDTDGNGFTPNNDLLNRPLVPPLQ